MYSYAVNFFDKDDTEGRIQCITAISKALAVEKDSTNLLRLVGAFGNLMHGNEEAKGYA